MIKAGCHEKRKVIKTLLVIITVLIIAAGCALFSLISGEKSNISAIAKARRGKRQSKNQARPLSTNYFLNLYYRGNKVNEKNTVIKRLTLFVDVGNMVKIKTIIFQNTPERN